VSFSPNHADITNYYLGFGVTAGFLAMALVIFMLIKAFKWVGIVYRAHFDQSRADSFMIWCLGAGLFAHATTSISVSYFDQSMVFFWMNIAVIGSMYSGHLEGKGFESDVEEDDDDDESPEVSSRNSIEV
jgi:hypothetical protein